MPQRYAEPAQQSLPGLHGAEKVSWDPATEVKERSVMSFLDVIFAVIMMQKGDASSFDLKLIICERFGIMMNDGSIYPKLRQMEKRRLIISQLSNDNNSRRLFSLTDIGERWCREMLENFKHIYKLISLFTVATEMFDDAPSSKGSSVTKTPLPELP